MFFWLGNVAWMVRGSGSTSPWCHMAPKPFTEKAAPQLLVLVLVLVLAQDWPRLPVGSHASRGGGPDQPALHAPGLPASSYSGSQAGGLGELIFGEGNRSIIKHCISPIRESFLPRKFPVIQYAED